MRTFPADPLRRTWALLVILTLATTVLAESTAPTGVSVLLIGAIAFIKGRLIIREFMEMKGARPLLYGALITYVMLFAIAMSFNW